MAVNGTALPNVIDVDPKTLARDSEAGSLLNPRDQLFVEFGDQGSVFDHGDLHAADIDEMMRRDDNARKIERVLSLPIRSAPYRLEGKGPGLELVKANVGPMLDRLIEQCTGASCFYRTFFEKVWEARDGHLQYAKIAWRPPTGCQAAFDDKTGEPTGFRQRTTHFSWTPPAAYWNSSMPGYIKIPGHKSFVYTHGAHRDPVRGVSDLEVAFNAYQLKQKIKFLWGVALERQSMYRIVAYGHGPAAQDNADRLAASKAGGIVPWETTGDPTEKTFEIVSGSSTGPMAFADALTYLDGAQTNSVLAGFTDLASAAGAGRGSYALSADQSEFFLASRQAEADAIADAITEQVFRPLVVLNFGPDADVPTLKIGPVGNKQTDRALNALTATVVAPQINAPDEWIAALLTGTAEQLGLDSDELRGAVESWVTAKRKQREDMAALAQAGPPDGQDKQEPGKPGEKPPPAGKTQQPPLPGMPAPGKPTPPKATA
jgi:hypothetical protein